jgi:hypothetical protein
MNRGEGARVHTSNLKEGETYRLRSRAGEGLVEIIEDKGMEGWLVKIKQGQFTVLETRHRSGDEFIAPASWDGWYEPQA